MISESVQADEICCENSTVINLTVACLLIQKKMTTKVAFSNFRAVMFAHKCHTFDTLFNFFLYFGRIGPTKFPEIQSVPPQSTIDAEGLSFCLAECNA